MKKHFLPIFLILIIIGICLFTFGFKENLQEPKPMSLEEFNKAVANKDKKVLVYFNASWCTVCAKMKPVIEQIETEYKTKLQILRIDADRDKEVAKEFEVDALPVLMLYRNGIREWTLVGLIEKDKLKNKIDTD